MPILRVTKSPEYKEIAMKTYIEKHLKRLKELGYSIEKDGFEQIEYMAYYMEYS